MAIALRYAARSDVGLVRSNNQDSGYAGPDLLIIADGMGGHAGGDIASSMAIGEMAPLNDMQHDAGEAALDELLESLRHVQRELEQRVAQEPALSGMGTTVTALLRVGSTRLGLAHIGDSRAYVLSNGRLDQITRDHTFVQRLVDDGRITLAEAEQHPQRSVLMRVLSDVMDDVDPDLSMIEARIGDRYLLCSDGLSGVVSFETIEETLAFGKDPASTCDQLVQLALRSGAPDNVTCIVADVVDPVSSPVSIEPVVVGAASLHPQPRIGFGGSAAERAAELTSTAPIPVVRDYDNRDHPGEQLYDDQYTDRYEDGYQQQPYQDEYRDGYPNQYDDQFDDRYEDGSSRQEEPPPGRRRGGHDQGDEGKGGKSRRGLRLGLFGLVLVLVLAGGAFGAYRWSQGQYFVGAEAGAVAIFKGLPQSVGPLDLKSIATRAPDVPLDGLSDESRSKVESGITAENEAAARSKVDDLRTEVQCREAAEQAAQTPTVEPTGSAGPTVEPTEGAGNGGNAGNAAQTNSTDTPTQSVGPTTPSTSPGGETSPDCGGTN
ncbi:PP2C family protein-serine/threonine phosphatase [Kineosporia babensis]|uniref:Protein phosphatase 2C domain-containing protein n=1 Tax=Kineosporia babensis TaxID=499548 RepID=A0A9X1NII1_9ACTN|nr:PP2C family serine/threonine-protein phosphatase [Kineosporia babensis]MCD5314685.1 protein phosphatase 2C domain-containing protein [Kineosporia babensis]